MNEMLLAARLDLAESLRAATTGHLQVMGGCERAGRCQF